MLMMASGQHLRTEIISTLHNYIAYSKADQIQIEGKVCQNNGFLCPILFFTNPLVLTASRISIAFPTCRFDGAIGLDAPSGFSTSVVFDGTT